MRGLFHTLSYLVLGKAAFLKYAETDKPLLEASREIAFLSAGETLTLISAVFSLAMHRT